MDPLVGLLVLAAYGSVVAAVAFVLIALERRQMRQRQAHELGQGKAQA